MIQTEIDSPKQKDSTCYLLTEARKAKGLTQEELAKRVGVDASHIEALEYGAESKTTTKTLLEIANALGTTVTELFFPDEKCSPRKETLAEREAARLLADEIFQLTETAEKAHFITCEIYDEGFTEESPKTHDDILSFAYKYERLRIQINVLLDYTSKLEKDLIELDSIATGKSFDDKIA